tara:strand:+ start:7487 stop:8803 length:1317 start_codon:yes stop_codon:yes gene_type:complete
MKTFKKKTTNWTRSIFVNPKINIPKSKNEIIKFISKENNMIVYGNGRSYGDVCLNKKNLIILKNFKKIKTFNKKKGILNAEAGIFLSEIIEVITKKGWFVPVTPGTKFLTLGGMVANNIHGKNLKYNYFIDHIISFQIITLKGKIKTCSSNINSKLYYATIGGLGLTGIITSVKFKLKKIKSTYVTQKKIFSDDINYLSTDLNKYKKYKYIYIWLNSFKKNNMIKNIIFLGNHKNSGGFEYKIKQRRINLFYKIIFSFLNNRIFYRFTTHGYFVLNKIFYKKTTHLDNFFYAQDKYLDWNKLYGKKGFFQFQILLPKNKILKFLDKFYLFCDKNKVYANLIVAKPQMKKRKFLNFYGTGVSLSFDFKFSKKSSYIKKFFLDNAINFGYIFNFSKDMFAKTNHLSNYTEYDLFRKTVKKFNRNKTFNSLLSNRLKLIND